MALSRHNASVCANQRFGTGVRFTFDASERAFGIKATDNFDTSIAVLDDGRMLCWSGEPCQQNTLNSTPVVTSRNTDRRVWIATPNPLNPAQLTWTTSPNDFPRQAGDPGTCALGNKLYTLGGWYWDGNPTGRKPWLYVGTIDNNNNIAWVYAGNLNHPAMGTANAVGPGGTYLGFQGITLIPLKDGRLLALGGFIQSNNGTGWLNTARPEVFFGAVNGTNVTWTRTSNLPKGLLMMYCGQLEDGRIIVAGGRSGQYLTRFSDFANLINWTNSPDVYIGTINGNGISWVTSTPLPNTLVPSIGNAPANSSRYQCQYFCNSFSASVIRIGESGFQLLGAAHQTPGSIWSTSAMFTNPNYKQQIDLYYNCWSGKVNSNGSITYDFWPGISTGAAAARTSYRVWPNNYVQVGTPDVVNVRRFPNEPLPFNKNDPKYNAWAVYNPRYRRIYWLDEWYGARAIGTNFADPIYGSGVRGGIPRSVMTNRL